MKDCRTIEFFEGDNGRLSMSRLLQFLSLFPCAVIAYKVNTAEAMLYLGSIYALGYVGGKIADAVQNRERSPTVNAAGPSTVNIVDKKGKK